MKKRIGIITFFYKNRNYGGLLQAYALQRCINNLLPEYDCEQIRYKLSPTPLKNRIRNLIYYMPFYELFRIILWDLLLGKIVAFIPNRHIKNLAKKRIEQFDNFEVGIPHSQEIYDHKTLKNSIGMYDIYIAGSDQIWNTGIDFESFLLKFVPDTLGKVSYAASSGGNIFKGIHRLILADNLARFDAVSVRESSLEEQLASLGDFIVKRVVDPVFLLSKEEWETILMTPQIQEPYVMCYLLGTNRKQRRIVEEVCKLKRYKLVTFPHIINNSFRLCDCNYGDIRDYSAGPEQFLGYIKNAEAIITDSFHAVAFSIIFHKNFCVLPRYINGRKSKSNNRIVELLERVRIENRIAESKEAILCMLNHSIEYDSNYEDEWKNDSKEWLLKVLDKNFDKEQGR